MTRLKLPEIEYPESDGEPMGETQIHIAHTLRLLQVLQHRYDGENVLVASNLLAYWVEGNPLACVCPDVFVVLDCHPDPPRRTFRTWQERRVPNFVIEVTSKKTRLRDLHEKPEIYLEIGVGEYFLYDATAEYLDPPLQGFRLHAGEYVRIEPDAEGRLVSEELDLVLHLNGDHLDLLDGTSEAVLLTEAQTERAARERSEAARRSERAAREVADAERRAERTARERAEADRESERTAREAAEAELARLRKHLADLDPDHQGQ
jgi:Uma2 family endonuclease